MNPEKQVWECDRQGLFVVRAWSDAEAKDGAKVAGGVLGESGEGGVLRALGWERSRRSWVRAGWG